MHTFMSGKEIDTPSVMSGMGTALSIIFLILLGTLHPVFAAAAFLCVLHILLRYENGGRILLFVLLPFAGIFKLAPGTTSLFTYLELICVLVYYARIRFLLSKADLILMILVFFMLLAELLSRKIAVTGTIKVLVNVLLLEQLLGQTGPKIRKKISLWFVTGVILSSFSALFLNAVFPLDRFLVLNQVEQYGQYGARVVRFAGLNVDPNYYTMNVILSFCLLIILYRQREISTGRICILSVILGVFAALTGSKSAFLMLAAVIVIYLTACYQGKRYGMLLVSCAVFAIGIAAVFSGKIAIFSNVLLRLQRSLTDFNSFTTGRFGIWMRYLRYWLENPETILLGRGVGITALNGRASHNTYLDMIYQLGILGSGTYLSCLYCIVRRYRVIFKRNILNYSGILCMMTMYFFLSQLQGYDLPFQLFLCLSVWNTKLTGKSGSDPGEPAEIQNLKFKEAETYG